MNKTYLLETLPERIEEIEELISELQKRVAELEKKVQPRKGEQKMLDENKIVEIRNAKLINLILDYAIENHMSLKEIDDCMKEVCKVYYSDGLIMRD